MRATDHQSGMTSHELLFLSSFVVKISQDKYSENSDFMFWPSIQLL